MDFDSLRQRQEEIGQEIQRIQRNFKKDSASRKTSKYVQDHLQELEALWEEFKGNDQQMNEASDAKTEDTYFTEEYFLQIQRFTMGYRKDLNSLVDHPVANPRSPGTNTRGNDSQEQSGSAVRMESNREFGQIHRFNWLMATTKTFLGQIDATRLEEAYFRLKIRAIEQTWDEITTLYRSLGEVLTQKEVEEYYATQESTSEMLINLYTGLKNTSEPTPMTEDYMRRSSFQQASMKMPRVELPKFDGNYLRWRQFCDLYVELVHNQQISDGQKLWFLKSCLQGDAERLIRHLSVSGANYNAAWKIITERYENPRLLVSSWLSKLLTQPTIQPGNAKAIRVLHDTIQECLLGLQGLSVDTSAWDPLLIYFFVKKLDRETHTLYEQSLEFPRQLPSFKKFLEFLEVRFQSLEALGYKDRSEESKPVKANQRVLTATTTQEPECRLCKGNHLLARCRKFLELTAANRRKFTKQSGLCLNCLKEGHFLKQCPSTSCLKCKERHNTLLHIETNAKLATARPTDPKSGDNAISAISNRKRSFVLLGTARVLVTNNENQQVECRALLDSGSQVNLISRRLIRSLNVKSKFDSLEIEGIGQGKQKTNARVNVAFKSLCTDYSSRVEAFVLDDIISPQPNQTLNIRDWSIPTNVQLADPSFYQTERIDLLLGAEFYYELLAEGKLKLGAGYPILQNTVLGWVVSGRIIERASGSTACGVGVGCDSLEEIIERFWRLEEVEESTSNVDSAQARCAVHFEENHSRDGQGRFVVSLPFACEPTALGESKQSALRRYFAIEKKMDRDPQFKALYSEFMEEYLQLEHMEEVDLSRLRGPHYFLPHHGVLKPDSTTTKLRVVFDASMKTSSNKSLNDILLAGPKIQDDVFSILLRFRTLRYVFIADIEKMYRQIIVSENCRRYQLIFWRRRAKEPIKCYQLNTVTYGLSSAPYLATRCLHQLAIDNASRFPLGARALKRDFYMDDVMSGSNQLSEAKQVQQELDHILKTAGFHLRKWCSNVPNLLKDIPQDDRALQTDLIDKESCQLKTLGLLWNPSSDVFVINAFPRNGPITKRSALSDIAHIYDPLGIISPITIGAKMFIQRLWKLRIDWDSELPTDLQKAWEKFREEMGAIKNIRIPRHVFKGKNAKKFQLHAFSDASKGAFGAAVYVRAAFEDGTVAVQLLCSKARVTPIKRGVDEEMVSATTIPRLELCGAKMATDLAYRVMQDLGWKEVDLYCWTDSEIVLSWINAEASNYHRFISNRISAIKARTLSNQWRHVPTKHNPADVVSRGVSPRKLMDSTIWFHGPMFLYGPEATWPGNLILDETDVEKKKSKIKTALPILAVSKINHHNSFARLQRIMAYVLRFIRGCKGKGRIHESLLSPLEIEEATRLILREIQAQAFNDEIRKLSKHQYVNSQSSLSSLSPFLDAEGILRVGGRLGAANLAYDVRHPILLPYNHEISWLIIEGVHLQNLHIGPQGLLAAVRQKYWPIKGKTMTRSVVQKCVRCSRTNPKLLTQMMGNLPADRIEPARPFVVSGVDFFGPVWIHFKVRGKQPRKAYVAVFCCFATKAVHFEIVADLTTDAFIGALRRFMGRRGNCQKLYCDNATNFVGARNQLRELEDVIHSNPAVERITATCNAKNIAFNFIPPRSPHFGGLWESAVKSAKFFLQRNLAHSNLTYEELETLMIEIEAILNSRPLTPLSTDPNDLSAITPGHFLIGEPLTQTISPRAESCNLTLRHRWKKINELKAVFWQRWSHEYLTELQHRYKWKTARANIRPGLLVIIKEDNLPPMKWPLGRIRSCIRGHDGLVRVVDVQTAHGISRRPIHRLAPLLMEEGPEKNLDAASEETLDGGTVDQSKGEREENSYKRPKFTANPLLLTMLLSLLLLPLIMASPIELSPFSSQPGIYFENLGRVHITSSEWSLVAFYDLKPYFQEFELVKNSSSTMSFLCDRMLSRDSCKRINAQIRHLETEITVGNQFLTHDSGKLRSRRGAFNVIGNVANALFGVLDSEYADKVSQEINEMHNNDKLLLSHLRNQTSFLAATANIMNRNQEAVVQHLDTLTKRVSDLSTRSNYITHKLMQQELNQLFEGLAMEAIMAIINFQRIQGAILDVLTSSHSGKISPLLMSRTQLKQELSKIREQLPTSLKLPVPYDDCTDIYKIATIKSGITRHHAIFRIGIPLVLADEFEIFSVVPVPVFTNKSSTSIKPSTPYLVTNLHRETYFPLTREEYQTCYTINQIELLCHQNGPLYHKGSDKNACELAMLNHRKDITGCKTEALPNKPYWLQLNQFNEWIYALPNETTLNVVCNSNTTRLSIRGSGILKMGADCELKYNFLTIRGNRIRSTVRRLSYTPMFNLTEVLLPEAPVDLYSLNLTYNGNAEEVQQLRLAIQRYQNNLPLDLSPSYSATLMGGAGAVFAVMLLAICGIGFYCLRRRRLTGTALKPEPLPRTRVEDPLSI